METNNQPIVEKKKHKLLGFRSNKVWKKILSIIYLVFCAFIVLGVLIDGRQGQITVYDFFIDKLYGVVILLLLLSPYIFLSNTKFRDKLPLLKKHKKGASVGAMAIILTVILILSGVVNGLHSKEYLADMENHAYIETLSNAATCEENGRIEYLCEYCGLTTAETITATGHTMQEISSDEEKIVSKCSICGTEKTEIKTKTPEVTETTKVTEAPTEKPNEQKHTHEYADVEYTPDFGKKKATVKKQCAACGDTETTKVDMSTEDIKTYLKANCSTYTYEQIARYPDEHKGKLVVFTGSVFQVQELLGTTTLMVQYTKVDNEYFAYYEDNVYVDYKYKDGLKVLEGDIITLYGVLEGEKTYVSVLGQVINVPLIKVYYAELSNAD